MSTQNLFSAANIGSLTLKNRMVMAPMTRNRAAKGNVPQAMNVEYYRQRASAGLIITEASQISAEAVGYPGTPGIYNDEQVAGWQIITEAVHDEGGLIYLQLWYCGRISHPDLLPDGQTPVAPSALTPEGEAITYEGMKTFVEPRALKTEEIQAITAQYKKAAIKAKQAANGYLIDQFLRDGSNHRSDEYGGKVENRMYFLNQVLDAVLEIWHSKHIGIRLSPENSFNSMSDSDPQTHFAYFIKQLNARDLGYLHILEGDMLGATRKVDYRVLRDAYNGIYMANNGYDKSRAQTALDNGDCDLVALGTPFIANPDLVYRYQHDLALNKADQVTFYGGNETGYTDYPLSEQKVVEPA